MPTDPTAAGCTEPCIACMTGESHDPAPNPAAPAPAPTVPTETEPVEPDNEARHEPADEKLERLRADNDRKDREFATCERLLREAYEENARLRSTAATLSSLAERWEQMADQNAASVGHFEGPTATTLNIEVAERGSTYRQAAADVREVLRTGCIPHDLLAGSEPAAPPVPADADLRDRFAGVLAYAEQVAATSGPGPASAVQAVIDRLRAALADEARQTETVSPAYARLQVAAKEATEAAHLHAMHGMKRAFQLARQYGNQPIPAAEVLNALGLDANANTVKPVTPAPVPDPSWPRRAWDLGLLHKGGDPHHCPACLRQPEPPAAFICPGDNTKVLANPQPAEEDDRA